MITRKCIVFKRKLYYLNDVLYYTNYQDMEVLGILMRHHGEDGI